MITLNGDTGIILPQNAEYEITADNGISAPSANAIALNTNGTQRLLVDSSGNFGIGTGTPAKTLDVVGDIRASTGILFGSDTAASNTLDDYETGTFTPFFGGSTSDPTTSYSFQNGYYVKIGDFVYAQFYLAISSTSGGSGDLLIKGMPFTSSSNSKSYGGGTVTYKLAWNSNGPDFFHLSQNSTTLVVVRDGNTTQISMGDSNLQAGTNLIASVWYFV